jgi:hypothetical protein
MNEEESLKYCAKYLMQRGVSEPAAKSFSHIAICAYESDPSQKTLQQTCEFILEVLESLNNSRVSQVQST